jgi:hypothetical protein
MLRNVQIEVLHPEVNASFTANGNGADMVNGRGLAHRPTAARLKLAVDMATGRKKLDPSLGQIADACGVSYIRLRRAIKAQTNGHEEAVAAEVAKSRLRAIVNLIGIDDAMNLLSEIEAEMQSEAAGIGIE